MQDPMQQFEPMPPRVLPPLGCAAIALSLFLICLMPIFLVEVMTRALARLHLSPAGATLCVVGIFVGSLINIPVHRFTREEEQPEIVMGPFGLGMMRPRYQRLRRETIIAINVGGCVIPTLLVFWQLGYLMREGAPEVLTLLGVCLVNIGVCYRVARPVPGIGIMMPAFISPLVAVSVTWLACGFVPAVNPEDMAPIAFSAGVAGPLIGADLLHLRDLLRTPAAVMSIGGAGTFDGIVLSGVLAALFA